MDPITLGILAALGGALLGGGTAYGVTKAAAQKRIAELQEHIRVLQKELQRKQKIIAGLQRELAELQQKLAERENRIAQMLEREANLREQLGLLQARVVSNSKWWRKVFAMLLFRYQRLLLETRQLIDEVHQLRGETEQSARLREELTAEMERIRAARAQASKSLAGHEDDWAKLRSKSDELDAEMSELLAS